MLTLSIMSKNATRRQVKAELGFIATQYLIDSVCAKI